MGGKFESRAPPHSTSWNMAASHRIPPLASLVPKKQAWPWHLYVLLQKEKVVRVALTSLSISVDR